MAIPVPVTVGEQISWSYANLARAHAALESGATTYKVVHHVIRNKIYYGLTSGKISMRSLYDDERIKMTAPQACYYCGAKSHLTVDHLIPRIRSGPDEADNLIWACRACNSSKGGKDLLAWSTAKGVFPSVLLLRRYLKIVARFCEQHSLVDTPLDDVVVADMPFDLRLLPTKFPPLRDLRLWVYPDAE